MASLSDKDLIQVVSALGDRCVKQISLSIKGADLLDNIQIMLAPLRERFFAVSLMLNMTSSVIF